MVEEIVLEGKPFDTQKKYLKKFSENEGLDYDTIEKGISELIETLKELRNGNANIVIKLALFQAEQCHVSKEEVNRIAELMAKQGKDVDPMLLTPVEHKGKYGYIDTSGQMVIEPKFDDGEYFSEKLAAVKVNNRWGYIDPTGEIVIEPRFDFVYPFREGMASVRVGDLYGAVDSNGNLIVTPQFQSSFHYSESAARVEMTDGQKALIDKNGKIIWKGEDCHFFFGRACFRMYQGQIWLY